MRWIHLLGASIGREWDFAGLPLRAGIRGYRFAFTARYEFDKSELLEELLAGAKGPPDAVVLKECAAWFPRDIASSMSLLRGWVERCRRAGSVPVPATVVPVVVNRSIGGRARGLWGRLRGRTDPRGRLRALLEYNDRLRGFVAGEGLALLDLEAALRIGERRRELRPELHSGDGLHLNREAYRILDRLVAPLLEDLFPPAGRERTARPDGAESGVMKRVPHLPRSPR